MDAIPYLRYILTIFVAGFLMIIFDNSIGMIEEFLPTSGQAMSIITALWNAIGFIVIIVESIALIRAIQLRKGIQ